MGQLLLETVAHAWRYERALTFHLSALTLWQPESCQVTATVFYAAEDEPVCRVLDYFSDLCVPAVTWNFRELPADRLCRRAIGRNIACLETRADFVLLCDVDYLFGCGALDSAAAAMVAATADGPRLMFPRLIQSSIDHAAGDAELARADCSPRILDIDAATYAPARMNRAIGGCQWLPGDWARARGYLSDSRRYQRPSGRWVKTTDDKAFRYWSGLESVALDVPGVFRIRHGKRGRYDIGCRN